MSFVRPEAASALYRWRETLVGGGVTAFGVWSALSTHGIMTWIGWGLTMAGLVLMAAGIQRARFRIPGQGPGMVRITEGQITYFGPLTGGAVALSELHQIQLDSTGKPAHWVLSQSGQNDLAIPLTSEGADGLFDVFASLPGMRTEFMLAQMKHTTGTAIIIWERVKHQTPRLASR